MSMLFGSKSDGNQAGISEKKVFVALDDIPDAAGPYCMSFGYDLQCLIRSIGTAGLVNPPILRQEPEDRLAVVTGFRRLRALESLGWRRAPCRIISEHDGSPLECLLMNLYDNLTTRALNGVEKGMVLRRLSRYAAERELVGRFLPELGLPANRGTLNFYLRLKELDLDILMEYAAGRLSESTVKALLDMDADTRSAVFRVIHELKLNVNQQKYVLEYLVDLSHIYGKPVPELLSDDKEIQDIFRDPRKNFPQKAKAFLRLLRTRRFPELTRAERAFHRMTSNLHLPKGVKIYASPGFESPDYLLEIRFRDGRELKGKVERLEEIEGLDEIRDPWDVENL